MDDTKCRGGGIDIKDIGPRGGNDDSSLRASPIIPYAPPGPGLTHARVKDIIKLFAKEPEKAKAVFEAERRGVVDGTPVIVDAARAKRLRALGNAIVPECARWIGERIIATTPQTEPGDAQHLQAP
jgi:hypothetical protein